jgi:hypothetical protein
MLEAPSKILASADPNASQKYASTANIWKALFRLKISDAKTTFPALINTMLRALELILDVTTMGHLFCSSTGR